MKKILMMLLAMVMVFSLVACGGSDEPEATPAPEAVEENLDDAAIAEGEDAEAPAEAEQEETAETEPAEELTFTGLIEEKKDFMIIVTSEDSADAYGFTLAEGVTCDAEVGDKVTITYTGDLEKFITDDAELLASKIELAE